MPSARAYAVAAPGERLKPALVPRRPIGPSDVLIDVDYCGICHSDIHTARGEWGGTRYPCVPGHEIVGRVNAVGSKVRRFKEGDRVGVGCMVASCGACGNCKRGLQQHCLTGATFTYNSPDGSGHTYGGYSERIVVQESFVLRIPKGLSPERAAPLLCAGITTYSPLKRWLKKKGASVGVLGLGGLGHMAVKLAAAMGAKVTVLSRSPGKAKDAKGLGAASFLLTTDAGAVAKAQGSLDLIIDTVSGPHDVSAALGLLATEGALIMVGASPEPLSVGAFPLIMGRRVLAGSLIGGVAETQEMLDFCARKKVQSDVEVIAMKKVNEAYERVLKGDVRYRFVLDLSTL
ncbi:MAG: NAD(P)-dependent alcohol dehydrogenase [Elusimicrobiota bacterium]|nr:NAD(P)-dependent alcohol dehydrogenase [Elusimicrobiota bacterium]